MNNKSQEINGEKQQFSLPFHISSLQNKKVELSYSGQDISTDGGALLLRELDQQIGLIDKINSCIDDGRDQRYINHQQSEMLRQRIFQIACGYEDGNDCNQLRSDPVFKVCAGKLPESESDLASQPTMCRLENSVTNRELYRITKTFIDAFISSYEQAPMMVILDADDTNHNTHGNQQLSLFNHYYNEYCYMPLHIYEGLSGKLITTLLKPGRRSKNVEVSAILKRIVSYLRAHWPKTMIIVRGDSHFCSPQFMDWAKDQRNIHFLTGLAGNSKLNELAKNRIDNAQLAFQHFGKPQKQYTSFQYKANSWTHAQRVIAKVEVTQKGTNVRYIVTDMKEYRASHLYEKGYCARANAELRIKDHKRYLRSDRSSCSSFKANQLRLFLHSAAYVLIHRLQNQALKHTSFMKVTMKTIQLKILKTAAYVSEMKTKVKIVFPKGFAQLLEQKQAFDNLSLSG